MHRFHEAVDLLVGNSDDSMWVKLAGAHLQDGKVSKLCEALRDNKQILSLDLSDNLIGSSGEAVGMVEQRRV